MRHFRFSSGDRWLFTVSFDGTTFDVTPPENRAPAQALDGMRSYFPLTFGCVWEAPYYERTVKFHERDADELARLLSILLSRQEGIELAYEEIT